MGSSARCQVRLNTEVPRWRAIAPRSRRPVITCVPLFERICHVLADSVRTTDICGVRGPPGSFHARVYSAYGVGDDDEH
jgi:hypothetical protein